MGSAEVNASENHVWLLSLLNPLYIGGLFQCYMLDRSICHLRGVMSILSLILFLMENYDSIYCRP